MYEFLRDIWEYKPEEQGYILVWARQNKLSRFFLSVDEAIDYIEVVKANYDLYVGIGLREAKLPAEKRGGNEDVCGIAGLAVDLDIQSDNPDIHKKQNLFGSIEDAIAFVRSVAFPPTHVVLSGHGVQAWWLFIEPWMFESDDERKQAADLARRWGNTFRWHAQQKDIDIDATHDLSRVYRIPDTFNRKVPEDIKPVELATSNDRRYSPDDFEQYITEAPLTQEERNIEVGDFTVNTMASPPFAKFDLLREANVRFRRSWDHKRTDLEDQTMSAYDQSLATLAARAGWTSQEMCDLICAHRSKYGEKSNHTLPDYIRRTIARALLSAGEELRRTALVQELVLTDDPELKKNKIASLLKLEVTKIVKFLSDPPTYHLMTPTGKVSLGPVTGLTQQNTFAAHVANATRMIPPKLKDSDWRDVVQSMLDILEEESAGEEATEIGEVRVWLSMYLADSKPTQNKKEAIQNNFPLVEESGATYIFSNGLRAWLHNTFGERTDVRSLGVRLKAFGCEPMIRSFSIDGKRTSRYLWKIPMEKLEFDGIDEEEESSAAE